MQDDMNNTKIECVRCGWEPEKEEIEEAGGLESFLMYWNSYPDADDPSYTNHMCPGCQDWIDAQ